MGVCDDEKAIFEKYAKEAVAADRAYRSAAADVGSASARWSSAEASLAHCSDTHYFEDLLGTCAAEEASVAAAEADYKAELADYEDAHEAIQEALFWLDVATDLYCDCLVAHPDDG